LVELALVMPLLALIVAGLIHFGSILHAQQVITNAARVGARRGAQAGASGSSVQNAVMDYCRGAGLNSSKVSTSVTIGSSTSDSVVVVRYQFSSPMQGLLAAMVKLITGNDYTPPSRLQAQCTMKY
jgi:Flp pilus assembly protein TadG